MTDQTRAAFEAHFQLTTRQAWQHPDGSYKFPEIQAKWEGYLAGVAATTDPMKLVQIRNVALEEAARICDDIELDPQPYASLAERAAEAIRERILITTLVPAQHIKTWQERAAELTSYPSPEQSYRLLQAEIDELRAVLAAAPVAAAAPGADDAKDAARYRWLRMNNIVANVRFHFANGESPYVYAEELDMAIDHNMNKP